jgi:2-keto-4-pentenoate hydratase/2-oxohepta-3-ene-1,7-dioic acid hydratase in catechol pathway
LPRPEIRIPRCSQEVDYEAELGVVIGRQAYDVEPEDALSYLAGYTCVNDISARDLQFGEGFGWVRGKSADTFCPVGPVLVTPDELPDLGDLPISCTVNDETVQESTTRNMIFDVSTLISHISRAITLNPGDLIVSGTPGGSALARTPKNWLKPGDVVCVTIEGIGTLQNPVSG